MILLWLNKATSSTYIKRAIFVFLFLIPTFNAIANSFLFNKYNVLALYGKACIDSNYYYISFSGDFGILPSESAKLITPLCFRHTHNLLSQFDYNVVNLEFLLSGFSGSQLSFVADDVSLNALKTCCYNLVSIANNHALDYGVFGLDYTKSKIESNGLQYFGIRDKPITSISNNGCVITICSLTESLDKDDPSDSVLMLREDNLQYVHRQIALANASIKIFFLHLGSMSVFPSPHEKAQIKRVLTMKPDLVVCTGTHRIKGYVIENGTPIVYGIGNFMLSYTDEYTEPIGMHIVAGIYRGKLVQVLAIPFYNTIPSGKCGPLDSVAYNQFESTLKERSQGGVEQFYQDSTSFQRLKNTIRNLKIEHLKRIKYRHIKYAVIIFMYQYPYHILVGGMVTCATVGLLWYCKKSQKPQNKNGNRTTVKNC